VIHYIWLSGEEIPAKNKAWMESWQKHCPDYEIVHWDGSNYDFTKNRYMHEAYQEKKWAFVTDYMRLDIIYQYGGVYLDVDVEVLANLDILLYDKAFCGFYDERIVDPGQGFGAVAGLPIIKEWRDYYDGLSFRNSDGSLNLTICCEYQTQVLNKYGLSTEQKSWQLIEGMRIYPRDVANPLDNMINPIAYTKNTLSVHYHNASWFDSEAMGERQITLQKHQKFRDAAI
jgi:hypothetical protein